MDINIILIALGIVVAGITAFIAYLGNKNIKLKDEQTATDLERFIVEKGNFYIDIVLTLANEIVMAKNQTVVDKLKADKDRKLTKEEGLDIFNEVKAEILCQLPEEGKKILEHVVEDLSQFLEVAIESAVRRNK